MKQSATPAASLPLTVLLVTALLTLSHSFAKSFTVGGYVPELRNLTVTPLSGEAAERPDGSVEVAIIAIDINLPDYELTLDFPPDGIHGNAVAEVRLEGMEVGALGLGLSAPRGEPLTAGPAPGRFVWSPGPQRTATLGYQVKVLVRYGSPSAARPPLTIAMNAAY